MPSFSDDLDRLIPHLRRFARALVRDHAMQSADDLVQETVLLALRAERMARGSDLTVWCFSTLMRVNRLRDPAPRAGRTRLQPGGGTSQAVAALPRDVALLDLLPLDEREVLLLVAIVGMSYAQVGATLHITPDAVLQRLGQARRHLASAVRPAPSRAATHLRVVK